MTKAPGDVDALIIIVEIHGSRAGLHGPVSEVGCADIKMYFQNGYQMYKTLLILSSDFLGTSRVAESIRTRNWALDHKKISKI